MQYENANLLNYVDIVKPGVAKFSGLKKYVSTGSLTNGKIIDPLDVDYHSKPSRANMEVQVDDVLFAKMKDTEKVLLITEKEKNHLFTTGFFILRIKDKSKILPKFVYYWLKSKEFQRNKNRKCKGATQKAINEKKLKKFTIPALPINVQEMMVSQLDKVENVNLLRRKSDKLTKEYLNSVFLDMFGDFWLNPKRWDLIEFGKVCAEIYRYPSFYGFKYVSKGVPVLKISNMTDSGTFSENLNLYDNIPAEVSKKYPRTIVKEGDIVMEVRGTYIGKCGFVPSKLVGAHTNPNTLRISLNQQKLLPETLLYLSFTKAWKVKIEKMARYWKAGFGTIQSKKIKKMKIPLPPIELQNKFAEIVHQVEQLKESQSQSRRQIDDLFNSSMQKAFKGELAC